MMAERRPSQRRESREPPFQEDQGVFMISVDAQLAGPPGTWHADLRRAVARVRAADFELTSDDLDTSLDLVAVAVRRPPPPILVESTPRGPS